MHARPPPPLGVHHVAVQVTDLAAAERFYVQVLGLRVLQRWPAREGDLTGDRSLWIDTGAGSFVALERASPLACPPHQAPFADPHAGWHLLAIRIAPDDRLRWESWFQEQGIEIVHRTGWTLYVRDPDGNRIGLSHHPELAHALPRQQSKAEDSASAGRERVG